VTNYFAGAGFSSGSGRESQYRNTARRNLAVWAWLGLLGGGLLEFIVLALVTSAQVQADGWFVFWMIVGFLLMAIGVASWAGSAVVRAIAYEQEYRHGPLAATAAVLPEEPREPRLDDASRHAGTDDDPIPVTDNVIR